MPALSLVAVPGRRKQTLELAQEIERRDFAGIYCSSFGDGIGLSLSLAHVTSRIPLGTGIAVIYQRSAIDMANAAAYIHEVSGGRFHLGLGVSHEPALQRLGVQAGKPLGDMRRYVERMRAAEPQTGKLPPIVLATLRTKMTAMSGEIAEGAMWANASLSHLGASLSHIPAEKLAGDFFIGNMLPTCVDDDREAAAAVCRKSMLGYLNLPNYRNYWKEAGYVEEMEAVEKALAADERDKLASLMTDRWLADSTLFGSASQIRDGLEKWFAAGMKTPILAPASTKGGQMKAFEEMFATFA
jgi:alkanesulfonate monooxygenase SsuD/methylene tetrahydromethanopterin reductase-like flavin-dependent oxidoreductase (luciferase family)